MPRPGWTLAGRIRQANPERQESAAIGVVLHDSRAMPRPAGSMHGRRPRPCWRLLRRSAAQRRLGTSSPEVKSGSRRRHSASGTRRPAPASWGRGTWGSSAHFRLTRDSGCRRRCTSPHPPRTTTLRRNGRSHSAVGEALRNGLQHPACCPNRGRLGRARAVAALWTVLITRWSALGRLLAAVSGGSQLVQDSRRTAT
jgi:hypothetical protein